MYPGFSDFVDQKVKIAVVGLGYVGLPLAFYFGRYYQVIGFDVNSQRVYELKNKYDRTGELTNEEMLQLNIDLTDDPHRLQEARLIIVTVPTPINNHKLPDLTMVKRASETIGRNLSKGTIIVYESTVYPGATEEVCVPILEKESGLNCGIDFKVGYSPERINPGDREHIFLQVVKVVSGQDAETAKLLGDIYGQVIDAGVYVTPDIRTAEAAKVIENIQRDLNIALMNELSLIFNKMNIDTREVLQAAATKWNFLRFEPGLVGGHCIGVDPYYLTYKAEEIGYHSTVILAGRRINDHMGKYIAEQTVKKLIEAGKSVKGSRVLILGITFKENVKDIRNTKVIDIYDELKEYGVESFIFDPIALLDEVKEEYGIELIPNSDSLKIFGPYDAIIMAVKHKILLNYNTQYWRKLCTNNPVFMDVKSVFNKDEAKDVGFLYWRL